MLAIDTNVLVRLVIDDHPQQAKAARTLLETKEVFVSSTVLLEAEWVLRNGYGLSRPTVVGALKAICGLSGVTLAEPDRVASALAWGAAGMDFADALHLAGADACEAFATFDRKLAKAAPGQDAPPIRLL